MEPIEILPQTIVLRNTGKYDQKVMVRDAGFILPAGEEVKVMAEESWEVIAYLSQEREGLEVDIVETGDGGKVEISTSIPTNGHNLTVKNPNLNLSVKEGDYYVTGSMAVADQSVLNAWGFSPEVKNVFVVKVTFEGEIDPETFSGTCYGTQVKPITYDKFDGPNYIYYIFNGNIPEFTIVYKANSTAEQKTIKVYNQATLEQAIPTSVENVTLVKSIDMGLGAVSLTNSKLKITKKSAGNYEVSGTMDLQDVATTQKLTYDPNTVRNFFVAAISLDLPAGVTFDVNTMSSSVTGTMPRGMDDVPKTLKNTDKIEGNTYTWLFNGKTSVITIKYTASDNVERTITITNKATLTTETQEFTKEVEGVVQGMEGSEYVTTVNVACETGWPFTGEYTITPGENCTRGVMDNIFGNGGMAQVKLYGTTDKVTMKATLKYTGTSDYQQTQPSND